MTNKATKLETEREQIQRSIDHNERKIDELGLRALWIDGGGGEGGGGE